MLSSTESGQRKRRIDMSACRFLQKQIAVFAVLDCVYFSIVLLRYDKNGDPLLTRQVEGCIPVENNERFIWLDSLAIPNAVR